MVIEVLIDQPERRRWWLLVKALDCFPLDRALDLARAADEFVLSPISIHPGLGASPPIPHVSIAEQIESPGPDGAAASRPPTADAQKHNRLPISPERRSELLDRLARGCRNTDVASEFELTPRQVQGIRMGAAREIAARRLHRESTPPPDQVSASLDEVVRYLRQRDDVVVANGNGEFTVNGRFHLGVGELVARANRMRERQNKPLLNVNGVCLPAQPGEAA